LTRALWGLAIWLWGDPILGSNFIFALMSLVGFLGANKLLQYLTRQSAIAVAGGFIFLVGLPYLQTARFVLGSVATLFAPRIGHLALYAALKAISRLTFRRVALGALVLSWLWRTHVIVGFGLCLRLAFLLGLQLLWALGRAFRAKLGSPSGARARATHPGALYALKIIARGALGGPSGSRPLSFRLLFNPGHL
jgi:hypothetical protein